MFLEKPLACNFIKKEAPAHVLFSEYWKILKATFWGTPHKHCFLNANVIIP